MLGNWGKRKKNHEGTKLFHEVHEVYYRDLRAFLVPLWLNLQSIVISSKNIQLGLPAPGLATDLII
jgi:hypothetical protein